MKSAKPAFSAGLLVVFSTIMVLPLPGSSRNTLDEGLLDVPLSPAICSIGVDKPLLHWIDDGPMAAFTARSSHCELLREHCPCELHEQRVRRFA